MDHYVQRHRRRPGEETRVLRVTMQREYWNLLAEEARESEDSVGYVVSRLLASLAETRIRSKREMVAARLASRAVIQGLEEVVRERDGR